MFLCWCFCVGVFVLVFLCWWFCVGGFVTLVLSNCFWCCGFMLLVLGWYLVMVFLWWSLVLLVLCCMLCVDRHVLMVKRVWLC